MMSLLAYVPQPWRFRFYVNGQTIRAMAGRLVRRKVACRDCGHFFDPADERAFLRPTRPEYRHLMPSCPACNQLSDGDKQWAVWNDCNGIFEVFCRKADAEKAAPNYPEGKVIPVRVLVEPEDDWWRRDMYERDITGTNDAAISATL